MKLKKAKSIGKKFIKRLAPYCERIEIAGSVRRGKPEVKDIEIVAQPTGKIIDRGIFGEDKTYAIYDRLGSMRDHHRYRFVKSGNRYYKIEIIKQDGSVLALIDLFLVMPPAQWGVIYSIRTGPAAFSKWLVSVRKPFYSFKDGQLIHHINGVLSTPEEKDVFNFLNIKYLTPHQRENEKLWKAKKLV